MKEVEGILCPSFVFCIGYLHHLYFSYELISPLFFACSLLSVALVIGYQKQGLIASGLIQAALVSYVLYDSPSLFLEQMAFSLSVLTALTATHYSRFGFETATTVVEPKPVVDESWHEEQRQKLRQELYDARAEITELYSQKQALSQQVALQIASVEKQHMNKVCELETRLEALQMEKAFLAEAKQEAEVDIAVLLDKMRQMAEEKVQKIEPDTQSQKRPQGPLQSFEAMYLQLREQFEEKSATLEAARRDLFKAEEDVEVLKRTLEYELQVPSQIEKALTEQLAKTNDALSALEKKHSDELVGYEEVIRGLLEQLGSRSSSG